MFCAIALPAFADELSIPFDYEIINGETDDDVLLPTQTIYIEGHGDMTRNSIEAFSAVSATSATTRGRAAAFIVMARDFGLLTGGTIPTGNRFEDVAVNIWEFPAVTWAANRGWVLGIAGTNRFNPTGNVTRQEFAVMLVRAFSTPLNSGTQLDRFSDRNQIASWAVPYVRRAVANGWILGFTDGTFRPTNNITIQDAITMTNRAPGRNISDPTVRTITWNGNGGTNPVQWQRAQGHAISILPTTSRANHTFAGWFNTSAATGGTRTAATTLMPSANTTYWARWTASFQPFDAWVSTAGGVLHVRSGPGTNHSSVGTLNNGTQVRVIGESDNWWQISSPTSGWVSKDFITRTNPNVGISVVWPMPNRHGLGRNNITSPFGWRSSVYPPRDHLGVDIAATRGERVNSMAAGIVAERGWWGGGGGNTVRVRHDNNYSSVYMHLDSFNVNLNARVQAGQQIGGAGNSGGNFGVHLHFEIRNRAGTSINPLEIWHWTDPRYPARNPNPVFILQNNRFVQNPNFTWP